MDHSIPHADPRQHRQSLHQRLIRARKTGRWFVDGLQHADDLALRVLDGRGEDGGGAVARRLVRRLVEARVVVRVVDRQDAAGGCALAGDASAARDADLVGALGDVQHELLRLAVHEEDRGAVAAEQRAALPDHALLRLERIER